MVITTQCVCGKRFRAPDDYNGRSVHCPSCGQKLVIGRANGAVPPTLPAARPLAKPDSGWKRTLLMASAGMLGILAMAALVSSLRFGYSDAPAVMLGGLATIAAVLAPFLMVWAFLCFPFLLLSAHVARAKGRSNSEAMVITFFFGPFGTLIVALLPTLEPQEVVMVKAREIDE